MARAPHLGVRGSAEAGDSRTDGQDFLDVINQAPAISGTLSRGMSLRLARTMIQEPERQPR